MSRDASRGESAGAARGPRDRRGLACAHLALAALTLSGAACHDADKTPPTVASANDPAVREAAIQRLVDASLGVFDSHSDADVGRVLQPGLAERELAGVPIGSNSQGLREREYELPKPAGLVRVVLLGDSFVFGSGVRADERLGVQLERDLAAGAGGRRVEVLHVGIDSWNVLAECAFVRRQLALLQPDLVVQFTVHNDISDTPGVRGFGARGRFTPRLRQRGDALVGDMLPYALGVPAVNWLSMGLDWESRTRFAEAGDAIVALARAVEAGGGRYLLVLNWARLNPIAREQWGSRLDERQVAFLPATFMEDPDWRISGADYHWNPAGHARVARLLYGLIVARGLLPGLDLPERAEATVELENLDAAGRLEAQGALPLEMVGGPDSPIGSELTLDDLEPAEVQQIHGGIDAEGRLGPYASVILRRGAGRRLAVAGTCLDRPELDGARIAVLVDEVPVGELELAAGARLERGWSLPEAVAGRAFLSVRFVADDFAYAPDDTQHLVCFRLERVALEP